jgi:hypothetical protein
MWELHADVRDKLQPVLDKTDGTFWMDFDTLFEIFGHMSITRMSLPIVETTQ